MVTRQAKGFKELPAQLLVMATPEKFALWASMSCVASAIVGWGPVHLMPARCMRSGAPRRYRLHSAAPAASAPATPAARSVAAGPGVWPSGWAEGVRSTGKTGWQASQQQHDCKAWHDCNIATSATAEQGSYSVSVSASGTAT
jgi:hypothetical protein